MSDDQRLITALILSIGILFVWQLWFAPSEISIIDQNEAIVSTEQSGTNNAPGVSASPGGSNQSVIASNSNLVADNSQEIGEKISITDSQLLGSISAQGSSFNKIELLNYKQSLEEGSPAVVVFDKQDKAKGYYASFGWSASGNDLNNVPGTNTVWEVIGNKQLTTEKPVTLQWTNTNGVVFTRTISLSRDYLFTIKDEITNNSSRPISAAPWGLIVRKQPTNLNSIYILHEGPVGYFDEDGLLELDYDDLEARPEEVVSSKGWLGTTDKYWAGILVPDQSGKFRARYTRRQAGADNIIQTDYVGSLITVEPNSNFSTTQSLFVGPKSPKIIDSIAEKQKFDGFELVIDWGIFHILTKPLAYAIEYFNSLIGNFGIAILIVTVIVKILFFPLAYKSYVSMSRMQKLQPKMMKIREDFPDDQAKQQKAMAELYRSEKVNPAAGCLPILLQIPVFFSLYKVIYILIDLRHAPFFGWIHDLSAPDPTSLFNLFGLLPFSTPSLLTIGVWPILMGLSMFVQMQLAPMQTINEMQRKIFTWMPLFFVFFLAPLPAGLIIYWVWNNVLSIGQQAYIMNRNGAKIALFDNLRNIFGKKNKPVEDTDAK